MTKPFYLHWQFWIVTAGLIACLLYIFVRPKQQEPTTSVTPTEQKPAYNLAADTIRQLQAAIAVLQRKDSALEKENAAYRQVIAFRDKQLKSIDHEITDFLNTLDHDVPVSWGYITDYFTRHFPDKGAAVPGNDEGQPER